LLTVAVGKAKVGVVMMVGVNVTVGVKVFVGVNVASGVSVEVVVEVTDVEVGVGCSCVEGAQAETNKKISKMLL
jgi:hypothetical protein